MKVGHHWRATGTLAIAAVAAVCLLIVVAVGSVPEYRWLAALLGAVAFTSLSSLASAWYVTLGGKRGGPFD